MVLGEWYADRPNEFSICFEVDKNKLEAPLKNRQLAEEKLYNLMFGSAKENRNFPKNIILPATSFNQLKQKPLTSKNTKYFCDTLEKNIDVYIGNKEDNVYVFLSNENIYVHDNVGGEVYCVDGNSEGSVFFSEQAYKNDEIIIYFEEKEYIPDVLSVYFENEEAGLTVEFGKNLFYFENATAINDLPNMLIISNMDNDVIYKLNFSENAVESTVHNKLREELLTNPLDLKLKIEGNDSYMIPAKFSSYFQMKQEKNNFGFISGIMNQ